MREEREGDSASVRVIAIIPQGLKRPLSLSISLPSSEVVDENKRTTFDLDAISVIGSTFVGIWGSAQWHMQCKYNRYMIPGILKQASALSSVMAADD